MGLEDNVPFDQSECDKTRRTYHTLIFDLEAHLYHSNTDLPIAYTARIAPHTYFLMSSSQPQGSGLRYPSNKKTIYDRNLNRSKNAELSRAAFAYLFIEMINLAQKNAKDVGDLEKR